MDKIINYLSGLRKLLQSIFKQICKNLENLLELFKHQTKKEEGIPACCIHIPEDKRPRPDPYIYSQEWLMKRGLDVTWENPDFVIFDMAGDVVPSNKLKPTTKYNIQVTIHNHGPMAAVNTKIDLSVHSFGIQTGVIWGSSTNILDVPAFGSKKTIFLWETPNQIGHICLKATIFHIDDANPLNNIGQHNTNIIKDNEKLVFKINNFSRMPQQVFFKFDTYTLPLEPLKAESLEELQGINYLKKLQKLNKVRPISDDNIDILNGFSNEITLKPDTEIEIEVNPKFFNNNDTLNISAFSANKVLLGGVTFTKP
jgi:hypothetical protein